ncbi:MAG: type II toxin-antitoxin system VapC family toxin [Syntrophomonadaceae bacterium]|nr:type II toxin-antitoxin system VapC family toxin [Syntrophomonadaceae bacterium]
MSCDFAIYWDSSAVISCLCTDMHSDRAIGVLKRPVYHLISSLTIAETCAVINRLGREGYLLDEQVNRALQTIINGPWRLLNLHPEPDDLRFLAAKWKLRGADLWHLGLAVRIKKDLPELQLLTFDRSLEQAGVGENLGEPTD